MIAIDRLEHVAQRVNARLDWLAAIVVHARFEFDDSDQSARLDLSEDYSATSIGRFDRRHGIAEPDFAVSVFGVAHDQSVRRNSIANRRGKFLRDSNGGSSDFESCLGGGLRREVRS